MCSKSVLSLFNFDAEFLGAFLSSGSRVIFPTSHIIGTPLGGKQNKKV